MKWKEKVGNRQTEGERRKRKGEELSIGIRKKMFPKGQILNEVYAVVDE